MNARRHSLEWRALVLAAALAASAAACSPRRGAELLVLGRGVWRSADIAYGPGPRQRLDVYRLYARRQPSPVVVFIYGGRWKYGTKRDYLLLAERLARRGWVVVVPDYRVYPAALFPAWVEDGASAVRWTVDNIARYDGDSARIYVVGHSAARR
jgi:acetyl esterase/lipase